MDEYKLCLEVRKVESTGCVERLLWWLTGKVRNQAQLLALGLEQRVGHWFYLLKWIRKDAEVGILDILNFMCLLEVQETVSFGSYMPELRSQLRGQNKRHKIGSHVNTACIKVMRLAEITCGGDSSW